MFDPLFILGILQGVAGGIAANESAREEQYYAGERANAYENQAAVITAQIEKIRQYVEDNQYSDAAIQKAIDNIGTLIDNASAQMQEAINIGMQSAIENMQQQYGWSVEDLNVQLADFEDAMEKSSNKFRIAWKEGYDQARSNMVKRRLAGSGADISFGKQALKQLTEGEKEITGQYSRTQQEFARQKERLAQQLQGNIRTARQNAAAQIAQTIGSMELQKGTQQEATRQRMEDINRALGQFGFTQTQQAELSRSLLEGEQSNQEAIANRPRDQLAEFLGGAIQGGSSSIITSLLYPQAPGGGRYGMR